MTYGLPRFDEAILEIGCLHGRRMAKDIKADLCKKSDVPEEALTAITTAIQQQIQTEQAIAAHLALQHMSPPPPHRQRIPIWKQTPPTT